MCRVGHASCAGDESSEEEEDKEEGEGEVDKEKSQTVSDETLIFRVMKVSVYIHTCTCIM